VAIWPDHSEIVPVYINLTIALSTDMVIWCYPAPSAGWGAKKFHFLNWIVILDRGAVL